jgi:DNA-binding response OmpR family regulator
MAKRILVIDDEASIRKSFELALEDSGYQVDTASSGAEGLEKKRSQPYDLIFLDLKMPGMSGVETLREIRKIDEAVLIYIVTAFYGEFFDELEDVAKEGMAFEVLQKPVSGDDILNICKGILDGPLLIKDENTS